MTQSIDVLVIGSGMAGLGAAYTLQQSGRQHLVVDQRERPGGHTTSWTDARGFVFDEGPHISFTKNPRLAKLFYENASGEVEENKASAGNYWNGRWIKHPAQCNLNALPRELIVEVLCDYHQACVNPRDTIDNYEDWLVASYGEKFARTFPMEYGEKYHTTSAANMSTDWLGPRLYRPTPEEIFRGAFFAETDDVHYISSFRYPRHGGFQTFIQPIWQNSTLRLGSTIVSIDPRARHVVLGSGEIIGYSNIISSMPLPEIIACLPDVPDDVCSAAAKLACSDCIIVNLGIDRDDLSPHHWLYFYDRDVVTTRACFPHMFSTGNAPEGCGSIQAEVYFSKKYRPRSLQPHEYIPIVKRDLLACGILRESDEILSEWVMSIEYANVIFDLERERSLRVVHDYVEELGIHCCGRYGEWGYLWTDESFESGERAASRL